MITGLVSLCFLVANSKCENRSSCLHPACARWSSYWKRWGKSLRRFYTTEVTIVDEEKSSKQRMWGIILQIGLQQGQHRTLWHLKQHVPNAVLLRQCDASLSSSHSPIYQLNTFCTLHFLPLHLPFFQPREWKEEEEEQCKQTVQAEMSTCYLRHPPHGWTGPSLQKYLRVLQWMLHNEWEAAQRKWILMLLLFIPPLDGIQCHH